MDLTNKITIKELLKKHGAKAEKYLGQHFILSKKALTSILAAAEVKVYEKIVEIGPGLGTLTQELAETGAKTTAIEKDKMMIEILGETLADYKNIKITQADAKTMDVGHLHPGKYKIVANLPYNVATFLIHQWLESKKPPEIMALMIQKEVAQRIVAKPPHMNLLAVSIQFYADVKIIDYVKAAAFWPRPKVDSAIIKIIPKKISPPKIRDAFFTITKAGFSQPRKILISNLAKRLAVPKEKLTKTFNDLNIPEKSRAENLTLEQWNSLAKRF